MKKQITYIACTLLIFVLLGAQATEDDNLKNFTDSSQPWAAAPYKYSDLKKASIPLIPYPRQAQWTEGKTLALPGSLSVLLTNTGVGTAYRSLEIALDANGIKTTASAARTAKTLCQISLNPGKINKPEGYRLTITENFINIEAHDPAGAFYAVQTLKQMLRGKDGKTTLPVCKINDYPAFKVRGFMHDTGRNHQTVESLKSQIDRFGEYKLNVFHWHLTDNPAWRPESNIYPELNAPENRRPGRDPESTYTFDQIRDVIAYAKQHHVMVIPELDMPGHSKYFEPTFGFGMGSPEGMDVLEKLIDEFCAEIPAADCPYLHLGADEVHIPKPDEFIKRMSAKVRANQRIPILWNPGLKPTDGKTVSQLWKDSSYSAAIEESKNPIIDSSGGYINSIDPQRIVQRYFFWQACKRAEGDDRALGGILCCWPDVNVDDKQNIFRHNAVWPAMLAFSETIWQGRTSSTKTLMVNPPERGSEAWVYFHEFEERLGDHRERYFANDPFPYVKQTSLQWSHTDPYGHKEGDKWDVAFTPETDVNDPNIKWHPISGSTALLPNWNQPIPCTRYLRTYLHSASDREVHLMIGFDTAVRANRRSPGIPQQGKWDGNGGTIFLNGTEIPAPVWKQPGKYRYDHRTWHQPPNEIPFTDEEFYWAREPTKVQLKKGANLILMRVPYVNKLQSYQASCIPVKKQGHRWIEDESITSTRNAVLSEKENKDQSLQDTIF